MSTHAAARNAKRTSNTSLVRLFLLNLFVEIVLCEPTSFSFMPRIPTPEELYHPVANHPVETIANLDRVPIEDNGEPLVDLSAACPALRLRPLNRTNLRARQSVAQRLNEAQSWLDTHHKGHRLVVVDAWRSDRMQRRGNFYGRCILRVLHPTWPKSLIREAANKYVADPDSLAPPPHSTGGAIDVRLEIVPPGSRRGRQFNLQGPPFKLSASRTDYSPLPENAKQGREILCAAMEHAGFSNYEEEWWHWSYGDSGWALRSNQPVAWYGRAGDGK